MTDELPTSGYLIRGDEGKVNIELGEPDNRYLEAFAGPQVSELVSREYLQPVWKTTCCDTNFMAKPEEAAFCPGCGAALYDEATGSNRELIDAMGRGYLEDISG